MPVQVAKPSVSRDDVVTWPERRNFRYEVGPRMRSGWPHTQDDHGRLPADQRQAPFGPEISWPTGYSNLEYRDGGYRYPAAQPAIGQGEHPYAAFSAAGYGDDGYSNPGYDGPASQDVGVAGTRTVRGFVESAPAQAGYPRAGYDQPLRYDGEDASYPAHDGYQQPAGYGQQGSYDQPDGYGFAGHPAPAYDP